MSLFQRTDVTEEDPIPRGWAMSVANNGRVFFIDHNTKQTTWVGEIAFTKSYV